MPLRPLRFSELFDAIVGSAVRDFWTYARLVLVVAIPLRIVEVVILATTVSNVHDITSRSVFRARTGSPTNGTVGVNLTVNLLSALIVVIATALCFKAASAAYAGSRARWRESAEFAMPRLSLVLWLAIIGGLGILAGFFALFVPGVWLAVAWSVAIPALLFETLGPTRALGRSFALVQGRWWATLGTLLVAGLISAIASGIVQSGFDALMSTGLGDHVATAAIVDAAGNAVAEAISLPILAIAVAMLYFDLRARKERLDTAELERRLGIEAGTPKAAAPSTDGPVSPPTGWQAPSPPSDAGPPAEWAPPRPPGSEEEVDR
jgi:hypothetical protein